MRLGQPICKRRRFRRGVISALLARGVPLIARLALLPVFPIPDPAVHDEASYLLAADTFAHGRLTNPPPPIPEPFETMHVLVRPTYMSKYPPGQGLFLALGQVIVANPIWGVWISRPLAAACTCWKLFAFVSARWALLGGVIMAIHPQMLEWGQRYWGGSVAVIGGALLLGGIGRLLRQINPAAAVATAIGILIIANTRPFEGLIITLLLSIGALAWLLRRGVRVPTIVSQIIAPASLVLLPGILWMGYYNYRVTGHPLRL